MHPLVKLTDYSYQGSRGKSLSAERSVLLVLAVSELAAQVVLLRGRQRVRVSERLAKEEWPLLGTRAHSSIQRREKGKSSQTI